jgi:hypothetical protein
MTEAHDVRSEPSHDELVLRRRGEGGSPMIAHPSPTSTVWRSTLVADVATAIAIAVFVAGMYLALTRIAPFELVPPRVR